LKGGGTRHAKGANGGGGVGARVVNPDAKTGSEMGDLQGNVHGLHSPRRING